MRHFATLALAALLLAPAAVAQSVTASPSLTAAPLASFAPGDTTLIANRSPSDALTTFSDGSGNYLFGTGSFGTEIFGSGYTLPSDAAFDAIGATLFVTQVPDAGETFDVSVYAGNIADGPTGDPLYTETFSTDIIPPRDGNTITSTRIEFAQDVPIFGEAFFIVYDVNAITSVFAAGATGLQTDPTPETVIFRDGAFVRVQDEFNSGGSPLQVYLYGEAIVVEVEPRDAPASPIVDARSAGIGADVTVEGTVSRAEGDFVYLQDETGGLTLRQSDENSQFFMDVASGAISPGTTIRISGTLSQFNGLLQINNDDLSSYEITGAGDPPAAQVVTLAELAANGEDYEGELVTVTDVTFSDLDSATGRFEARTTYQVTDPSDATNAVTVRVPNADDTTIDGTDFLGSPAIVTGVVAQFSSTDPAAGYQITLVQAGDVLSAAVAVGGDPDGRLSLGSLLPNPSADEATVTVSLASAGRATLVVYDVLGREVARVLDRDVVAGDHVVRVDVSAFDAGTYLARLTANGAMAVRPFTVVR
ncbi:T9SS type A sorting domain-containing protein [Rubrivirga sp. IMCC43871]|uniref:T9SS type A sorting domain-containing protein n=1 Tax=Rubrivirga sp. IMCC43871 TaxID=3391575 RepID=UPI00398F963A